METSREGAVNVETIVKGSSEVITVNILNGFFPRDGYSPYLSEGFLCSLRLIPTFCILWHDLNTLYGTQRLFSSVLRLGNRFKVEVCSKIADLGFSTLWRVLEILWRDFARIWLELRSSASFLMDSVCLVMRCYQETHGSCRREAVDFCKTRGLCRKVLHWNVVVFTWSACRNLEVSARYSCEMASSAKASAGEDGAASRRINFVLTLDLFTDFCSIHPAFRESSFCSRIATLILRTRCFFVGDGVFVAKPDLGTSCPFTIFVVTIGASFATCPPIFWAVFFFLENNKVLRHWSTFEEFSPSGPQRLLCSRELSWRPYNRSPRTRRTA